MKKKAIICVNAAVLLFGLAGLFAKWIHLPAICITFGRVLFSSISLGLYLLIRKQSIRVSKKDAAMLLIAGVILALHWWAFLGSIQLSTVAIGTITFSAFPLFVTFLEPFIFHHKLQWRSVGAAVLILAGVLITIPEFSPEDHMFIGMAEKISSTVTAFYEQAAAAVVLLPFVIQMNVQTSASDLELLLFLGVITTALAHTLFISSLETLPAQLAGICSSMETVYGIIFAFLLLGEVPAIREIIGAVIIVGTVTAAQVHAE